MMKKIKIFEAFAGYGGASFSLKRIGIDFEVIGYSEINKGAIKVYEQNHGKIKNYGDITKIIPEELPDFDLFTGGFPCQPFSKAGLKTGVNHKKGLLFNDIIRILEVKRPEVILLENVKGLLSNKFNDFYLYTLKELSRLGYYIYREFNYNQNRDTIPVLNSKDYGIPQNRERVWYIGFRDFSKVMKFQIPRKKKLDLFVEDILLKDVDEKYYISEKRVEIIKNRNRYGDHLYERIPKIWHTLCAIGVSDVGYVRDNKGMRYLTPREAFRLMGFLNDEININNISDNVLYKLAGNGWDVNLVSKIMKEIIRVLEK